MQDLPIKTQETGSLAVSAICNIFLRKNPVSDQEFLDGTSPRIYPWNQSKIENLKSSSPRIYPWGQSKI